MSENLKKMSVSVTRDDLIAFEADIAAEYNAGKIRAPVHLAGGNEDSLIDIFKHVRENDWVFCTWRSHFHALLHGIPPEKVKAEIMAGRSIALCFPEYRFFSSAIVGGILPIALGAAWSIKRNGGLEKAWAFVGDMAAMGGMFWECSQYAAGHGLPLNIVIENNGKSVCTDTKQAWRAPPHERKYTATYMRYSYDLPWPHSGAGRRVEF